MSCPDQTNEYACALVKGKVLCQSLRELRPDDEEHKQLLDLYEIETDRLRVNVVNHIRTALATIGLTINNLRYVEVKSPGKDEVAYTNYFDAENGIIICNENYKARDKNPPGNRLWPSEILWQSWTMEAKTMQCSPSDLKAIVRLQIVNETTKHIIWHALQSSTSSKEGPDFLREYTNIDDGYHAILGSPNGASVMRMLKDHTAAIGHRTIERVIVLGDDQTTLEAPQSRTLALVLTSS